ncbi:MAG TPA: hypothetical protein VGL38_07640 [bacterium]|jgi:hypothetical protein
MVGIIIIVVLVGVAVAAFYTISSSKRMCPHCHSTMPKKSVKCPHCRRAVPLGY